MKQIIVILLLVPLMGCSLFQTVISTKVAPQNQDVNSPVIYANLSPVEDTHA